MIDESQAVESINDIAPSSGNVKNENEK